MRAVAIGVLTALLAAAVSGPGSAEAQNGPIDGMSDDEFLESIGISGCDNVLKLGVYVDHLYLACEIVAGGSQLFEGRFEIPDGNVRAAVMAQSMADNVRFAVAHDREIVISYTPGKWGRDGARELIGITVNVPTD